jgi:L-seryl-tRNA(Ser) seleniumtransferase
MTTDPRRGLPSVDAVLTALPGLPAGGPERALATEAAREVLAEARDSALAGAQPSVQELAARARLAFERRLSPSLVRVVNASGVILQTNLGRAPLGRAALEAMTEAAAYSNLEFDLGTGTRGSRHEHIRDLVRRATGAEDGLVVNNNAAALFMVLQVFAHGREVIVSRGQAVEIGGGFRIPDVLRQSGAQLVEVGTTNRTYASDYEASITANTAAILRVHTSNFQVVGFTAEPTIGELAEVARRRGVLLIDDLGSGCLVETRSYGLAHEPTVQESLAAGSDLALFSGDKLLGGPQTGIIAGKSELVAELRRHPLVRALRVDKLTIAALNATLMQYVLGRQDSEVPVWEMLRREPASLRRRARRWARAAGERGAVVQSKTMVGGGSLPGQGVETWCAAVRDVGGADGLARRLRERQVPVIGRIEDGVVLLDPRTVDPADDRLVEVAVTSVLREPGG